MYTPWIIDHVLGMPCPAIKGRWLLATLVRKYLPSICINIYMYMKSLIPKGAKSTFVTSEKNAFLCASLYTRLWKTRYFYNYNIFFSLIIRIIYAF